jgi:Cys-rich protein (TIGR01571 family)
VDPRRASAAEVGVKGECGVKFSSPSYAYAWNAFILGACPPIRVWWRWSFREKYVVKGSLCGDIISVCLCYLCTAMQEQREMRVARDPLYVAVKKIDGASLPTTYNAMYSGKVRFNPY